VTRAATGEPHVRAWLERARELDADVVIPAVTLTEVVRGTPRDARVNRVVEAAEVWPIMEPLARRAGGLLGDAGSDSTVDALVAATALAAIEERGGSRCVVLTSDPDDLSTLLAAAPSVVVVAV
jgi:predicted nucleic acid-binding protein